jgi:hypothetical protein
MNHILIWSVPLGVLKFPVISANSMTGYHKLKSLLRNGNTMCSDQSELTKLRKDLERVCAQSTGIGPSRQEQRSCLVSLSC